jgi:hypothetical protein
VAEKDEEFRTRIVERDDPVWLTEHDVEAAFTKVLSAAIVRRSSARRAVNESLEAKL